MTLRKFKNYDLEDFPPVLAWNPIAMRCDRVDEGCRNCWHLRYCNRAKNNPLFAEPLREAYAGKHPPVVRSELIVDGADFGKNPRVIATLFMGDLWHEAVTDAMRSHVVRAFLDNPRHIFLLLTKHPERVTEVLPDNCWFGTSVHDQASAELRVPKLLATKCKHKWLSCEPMLDFIDFAGESWDYKCGPGKIEWISCGLETGPGARNTDYFLFESFAWHCELRKIPFYDKRDRYICCDCEKTSDKYIFTHYSGPVPVCPKCKRYAVLNNPGITRREWPREWREKTGDKQ